MTTPSQEPFRWATNRGAKCSQISREFTSYVISFVGTMYDVWEDVCSLHETNELSDII